MNESRKMSQKNYPHIRITCPECKSKEILYDNFHDETFCEKCGLIIKDNTLFSIPKAIIKSQQKEKFIRSLWYKKIEFKK